MQRRKALATEILCLSITTILANMTAYLFLHVSLQDGKLGDLPIFLQHFAEAGEVKGLNQNARKSQPSSKKNTGDSQGSIVDPSRSLNEQAHAKNCQHRTCNA